MPLSEADAQQPTAAEMAAKLANPTAALGSLSHNFDFTQFGGNLPGAGDQTGWKYVFQPQLPFPQGGAALIFRPALPILFKQPIATGPGVWENKVELGDIGYDVAYGGTSKSGLMLLGGLAGSVPTATGSIATGQWRLGPELLVGLSKKWGVVGVLANHQWGFGGAGEEANVSGGQYFYAFPILGGSWQIASGPTFSVNHNLQGEQWTLPVGIGLANTALIGGNVWKFAFEYWYYVLRPDALGPDNQVRFTITQVVSLPWGQ